MNTVIKMRFNKLWSQIFDRWPYFPSELPHTHSGISSVITYQRQTTKKTGKQTKNTYFVRLLWLASEIPCTKMSYWACKIYWKVLWHSFGTNTPTRRWLLAPKSGPRWKLWRCVSNWRILLLRKETLGFPGGMSYWRAVSARMWSKNSDYWVPLGNTNMRSLAYSNM